MQVHRIAFILFCGLGLAACGSLMQSSPEELNARANQAYFSGKYQAALQGYGASRDASKSAGDKQYEAIATFGMARANVQLCNFSAADELFQRSIQLRQAIPDIQFAKVTQNLVEYSRFLLSLNRPLDALPLIERAIPDLEKSGIEKSDPIAYADFYDDYGAALRQAGRDSSAATAKAAYLRKNHPGRTARFKPTQFPKHCTTN